jgi:hypothetical protein
VGGDTTDKKTIGLFVESCGTSQETRQKGIEGGERDQAASIFKNELGGEIGVASLDAGASFLDGKLSKDVVVVKTPAGAVQFGADRSEGFKEFEQAHIIMALALNDG